MTVENGQLPSDIENITFDRETVKKLMKNKSFASVVNESVRQDPREALLRTAGFSQLDNKALMAIAKSLNRGNSAQSVEQQIKRGALA